ncbi:MAG: 2-hydroxyacid dehydrogenase [Treponema sp.]|jgi:D-3-phosphoglycerate dehydrogenase|nr:2-hydroxyacid dehydrogenase [Treponema sp.]
MAKIKTAVTAVVEEKCLRELEKFCEIKTGGHGKTGIIMPEEELCEFAAGAEILIVEFEEVTRKVIEGAKNLRLIVCSRGNPINIDGTAAAERKIPVVFTPGRNANAVAEFIVGSMISLCRNLGRANHELRNGRFLDGPRDDVYKPSDKDDLVWLIEEKDSPYVTYKGYEITGKTLGFVGFGAIGARTVELLAGFRMRFTAFDPYCPAELAAKYGVRLTGLDEVFAESDFVSINCKVTDETRGMIGKAQFDRMRGGAYFINTARGSIVRQKDFVEAMEQGKIAGAVLDVFWQEPLPSNHPLFGMPNVLITPHIGGASHDVVSYYSGMILEEIERYVRQEPLKNVFNRI